jgi:hypothetical protein
MADLHTRFKRREGILQQNVSGSLMLYNMEEGQYFALDDVGVRVWELCDGTRQLGEVVEVLCSEYDAPAATIGNDVLSLIRDLTDEELVVEVGEPASGRT